MRYSDDGSALIEVPWVILQPAGKLDLVQVTASVDRLGQWTSSARDLQSAIEREVRRIGVPPGWHPNPIAEVALTIAREFNGEALLIPKVDDPSKDSDGRQIVN